MTMTAAQWAARLTAAAEFADPIASRSLLRTAGELADDQREEIARRTGRTAETISAVNADGDLIRRGDLEAYVGAGEEGNDGFVGRFLETGTARTPPQPWAFQTVDRRAEELADDLGNLIARSI